MAYLIFVEISRNKKKISIVLDDNVFTNYSKVLHWIARRQCASFLLMGVKISWLIINKCMHVICTVLYTAECFTHIS